MNADDILGLDGVEIPVGKSVVPHRTYRIEGLKAPTQTGVVTLAVASDLRGQTQIAREQWPKADVLCLIGDLTDGTDRQMMDVREWMLTATAEKRFSKILCSPGPKDHWFHDKSNLDAQRLLDDRESKLRTVRFCRDESIKIFGLPLYFHAWNESINLKKLEESVFFFTTKMPRTVRDVTLNKHGREFHTGSKDLCDTLQDMLRRDAGPSAVFATGPVHSYGITQLRLVKQGVPKDEQPLMDVHNPTVSASFSPIVVSVEELTE